MRLRTTGLSNLAICTGTKQEVDMSEISVIEINDCIGRQNTLTITIRDLSLGLYLSWKRSGKLSITAEAATQISGYIG